MVTRIAPLIVILFALQGCTSQNSTTSIAVVIAGKSFNLELELDQQSRAKGMMHRTSIPENSGLLFVFPDAVERSFWMKNCFVNIDLIFLDSRGTITAVHEMPIEPPQSEEETDFQYEERLNHYWSQGPARFAIELASGSISQLRLQVNDRITLDLPYLKSIAR